MALNLIPIALGLGAFYFISQKKDEDLRQPPSLFPCKDLEGVYKFRDSSKPGDALADTQDPNQQFLPFTQDSFKNVRDFIVKEFNDNPNAVYSDQIQGGNPSDNFAAGLEGVKISVVRKAEKHLTAHIDPACPWASDKKAGWTTRMELIHGAVNRVFDRIYCRNLPGIWITASGNNLPVTQAFYDVARSAMESLAATNPNTSKVDSVELALNGIFKDVGCGWGGAYQIPYSDHQNDLIAAMGAIYDQVRA